MAYHRLEPFGQDYLHLMIAQLMLATGNLRRGVTLSELVPGELVPGDAPAGDALRVKADAVFAQLRATGLPKRGDRRQG